MWPLKRRRVGRPCSRVARGHGSLQCPLSQLVTPGISARKPTMFWGPRPPRREGLSRLAQSESLYLCSHALSLPRKPSHSAQRSQSDLDFQNPGPLGRFSGRLPSLHLPCSAEFCDSIVKMVQCGQQCAHTAPSPLPSQSPSESQADAQDVLTDLLD